MSSIAYVSDESMIAYHRLQGSRSLNFWRLTTRNTFTDFDKGDLLFFYCKEQGYKNKAFVGYGHYERNESLTLNQMWKRYEKENGFDTKEDLKNQIEQLSRNHEVPKKMNCLYLTDIVFFEQPVFPSDVGLKISPKLESYTYLDQNDSNATVRILRKAEEFGIDRWSTLDYKRSENIFKKDEVRHNLAYISTLIKEDEITKAESKRAFSLLKKAMNEGYEQIRNSNDSFLFDGTTLTIRIPFAPNKKDYGERYQLVAGRIVMYMIHIRSTQCVKTLKFDIDTVDHFDRS